MKDYVVTITEVVSYELVVHTTSPEKAESLARETVSTKGTACLDLVGVLERTYDVEESK